MNTGKFTPALFSILSGKFSFRDLRGDLLAGITVAIVALPLSMALAIASGASPDKGLITAIVAGGLISLLGGSRFQIGGPTGAFVVVVFSIISRHGYDGLVLATFLAGIILVISGYAGLGQVIKYIPHPVVTGFTSGIAVIIFSSQVQDFFGFTGKAPAEFIAKWEYYFVSLTDATIGALIVGVSSLALILLLRRFAPRFPGYLLAVVLLSVIVYFLPFQVDTVGSRFPAIPSGLPWPGMPDFGWKKIVEVFPSALTIAFLGGLEALLSAVVADGMTGYRHNSGQELVGQGFANIASALFGGLPATGAIARTATNIKAGGKTPLAGIFHALFILVFLLLASGLVKYIPMPVLAAILFVVAWGMSEAGKFRHILVHSPSERFVLLLTFGLTVLVDLTVAIGVGITLSSLLFMRQMSQSFEIDSTGDIPEEDNSRSELPPGTEVFHITGPVFFGVAGNLMTVLRKMGQPPRVLIVRMKWMPFLDSSGVNAIAELIQYCRNQNIAIILSGLQKKPLHTLLEEGFRNHSQGLYFSSDYEKALRLARKLTEEKTQ